MFKNQKGFANIIIAAIFAVLLLGSAGYYFYSNIPAKKADINNPVATSTTIIGGDKDEHGCLGPAGYSWCAVKNKCLRVWEEKCE